MKHFLGITTILLLCATTSLFPMENQEKKSTPTRLLSYNELITLAAETTGMAKENLFSKNEKELTKLIVLASRLIRNSKNEIEIVPLTQKSNGPEKHDADALKINRASSPNSYFD